MRVSSQWRGEGEVEGDESCIAMCGEGSIMSDSVCYPLGS